MWHYFIIKLERGELPHKQVLKLMAESTDTTQTCSKNGRPNLFRLEHFKSPYCDREGGPHLHFEVLHLHFEVQQTRSYLMIWRQNMPCIHIAKTLFCPQILCLLPQLSNLLVTNHSPTATHDLGVSALFEREQPAAEQSSGGSLQIHWKLDYWDPCLKILAKILREKRIPWKGTGGSVFYQSYCSASEAHSYSLF